MPVGISLTGIVMFSTALLTQDDQRGLLKMWQGEWLPARSGARQMSDSYVTVGPRSTTSYVGPDATNLVRAILLKSSLTLWCTTGMVPSRNVTATDMFKMATGYTGKTYRVSRGRAMDAAADLTQWIEAMKSALPVVRS